MNWNHYPIGDGCLCWQLGDAISLDVSTRVIHLYREVKSKMLGCDPNIFDVVPSYNALAIHFDPALVDPHSIALQMDDLIRLLPEEIPIGQGRQHTLPVKYTGPDLHLVALHCNLSEAEVVRIHAAGNYHVAMIGFKPHFPYLIGMDHRLSTPRQETPRTRVPAGAVAIGGAQTGVYPCDSPGGWNIIGMTDPDLLIPVMPGDTICFSRA